MKFNGKSAREETNVYFGKELRAKVHAWDKLCWSLLNKASLGFFRRVRRNCGHLSELFRGMQTWREQQHIVDRQLRCHMNLLCVRENYIAYVFGRGQNTNACKYQLLIIVVHT